MNGAENNLAVFLAIAGAALVTYAFRFGGLLLSEKLPSTGKFKDFMEALPGTILVALVAPGIIAAGFGQECIPGPGILGDKAVAPTFGCCEYPPGAEVVGSESIQGSANRLGIDLAHQLADELFLPTQCTV